MSRLEDSPVVPVSLDQLNPIPPVTELKQVTILLHVTGGNFQGAQQAVDSIIRNLNRKDFTLIVGINAADRPTRAHFEELMRSGVIDHLQVSIPNIGKWAMIKRLLPIVQTPFVWLLDDSIVIIDSGALKRRLEAAMYSHSEIVAWGQKCFVTNNFLCGRYDAESFVQRAPWFRGLAPPNGNGGNSGKWHFISGSCLFLRTQSFRSLNWPPSELRRHDDIILGEAMRQQRWQIKDIGRMGTAKQIPERTCEMENTLFQLVPVDEGGPDLGGWFADTDAVCYQEFVCCIKNGTIVEIGSWKGRSLSTIVDMCHERNNRIVAVDSWEEPLIREIFLSNLVKLKAQDVVEVQHGEADDLAVGFQDGSVDLVFIDLPPSKELLTRTIREWKPKLGASGFFAGANFSSPEVRKVVLESFPRIEMHGNLWKSVHEFPHVIQRTRGCVVIPTFQDSALLKENFGNRLRSTDELDIYVFDDNAEPEISMNVRRLCEENDWRYRHSGQPQHENLSNEMRDSSPYVQFIWRSMTSLAHEYDYVVKMDTDAFIIEEDWYEDFAHKLTNKFTIAGTLELRPSCESTSFWKRAGEQGHPWRPRVFESHMQGGIYGMSSSALIAVGNMGFLLGPHTGYGEDRYMSFCGRLKGVEFLSTPSVGSWSRLNRPPLSVISHLKAIHPLIQSEWVEFQCSHEKHTV